MRRDRTGEPIDDDTDDTTTDAPPPMTRDQARDHIRHVLNRDDNDQDNTT